MSRVAIVHRPIDTPALLAEISDSSCGAVTLFLGTVRDVNDGRAVAGMEYSAYEPMAVKEMERIAEEVKTRFDVHRFIVVHRIGELALGEASVAIVAAHAHRQAALDASRYAIEELKKRVPVWKREQYVDGSREWIDPTRAAQESAR
jgi:molybdopterin synthase catalytic subunit